MKKMVIRDMFCGSTIVVILTVKNGFEDEITKNISLGKNIDLSDEKRLLHVEFIREGINDKIVNYIRKEYPQNVFALRLFRNEIEKEIKTVETRIEEMLDAIGKKYGIWVMETEVFLTRQWIYSTYFPYVQHEYQKEVNLYE